MNPNGIENTIFWVGISHTEFVGFRHHVPVPDTTTYFYQIWQTGGTVSLHGYGCLTGYCCSDWVYREAVFPLGGDSNYLSDGINSS
jgi:hypothetical protein